jgi:hypothetical protein
MFLTIAGPMRLVTLSGKRFQMSIATRYFGFAGDRSGTFPPGRTQ